MAQPPLDEAQEAKADATAKTMTRIAIVFLILWYLLNETKIAWLRRNWHQEIQRTDTEIRLGGCFEG